MTFAESFQSIRKKISFFQKNCAMLMLIMLFFEFQCVCVSLNLIYRL